MSWSVPMMRTTRPSSPTTPSPRARTDRTAPSARTMRCSKANGAGSVRIRASRVFTRSASAPWMNWPKPRLMWILGPRGEAEDPAHLVGEDQLVGFDVPLPAPDLRDPLGLGQLALARPQLPLGAPLVGDVPGDDHAADDRPLLVGQGHEVLGPQPGRRRRPGGRPPAPSCRRSGRASSPRARRAAPVAAQIRSRGSKASRTRSGRCSARSRKPASPAGALLTASAVTVDLPPCTDQGRQETTTAN
jgi:hypothetical protein